MRRPAMRRRTVLRIGHLMVVGGVLAACGEPQRQPRGSRNTVPPLPSLTINVMHDALVFSQAIGGTIAADQIEPWVDTLPPAQRTAIKEMNQKLVDNGMSNFGAGKAFALPELVAYDVRHVNGQDGCLLIYKGTERVAALEGPALAGLVRAAASWSAPGGVTAQQALLPRAKIQDGPSAFGQGMLQPSISKTAIGTLQVNYQTTPARPLGSTLVTVTHDNGATLFVQEYDLAQP